MENGIRIYEKNLFEVVTFKYNHFLKLSNRKVNDKFIYLGAKSYNFSMKITYNLTAMKNNDNINNPIWRLI